MSSYVNYGYDNKSFNINGKQVLLQDNKIKNIFRIDERNLVLCKDLNLRLSTIYHLDTTYLEDLRSLNIFSTNINSINTTKL